MLIAAVQICTDTYASINTTNNYRNNDSATWMGSPNASGWAWWSEMARLKRGKTGITDLCVRRIARRAVGIWNTPANARLCAVSGHWEPTVDGQQWARRRRLRRERRMPERVVFCRSLCIELTHRPPIKLDEPACDTAPCGVSLVWAYAAFRTRAPDCNGSLPCRVRYAALVHRRTAHHADDSCP